MSFSDNPSEKIRINSKRKRRKKKKKKEEERKRNSITTVMRAEVNLNSVVYVTPLCTIVFVYAYTRVRKCTYGKLGKRFPPTLFWPRKTCRLPGWWHFSSARNATLDFNLIKTFRDNYFHAKLANFATLSWRKMPPWNLWKRILYWSFLSWVLSLEWRSSPEETSEN